MSTRSFRAGTPKYRPMPLHTVPEFTTIDPKAVSLGHIHYVLLSLVAPRPIAFVSTLDADGTPNLSPFSYFNVFGINPPVLIFSPARSVRTMQLKNTLEIIRETGECVVNTVDWPLAEQASLASCEYPRGVNEFMKAGLTPLPSDLVKPFRVAESPANLECRLIQVIETGEGGGAGFLVLCEIVKVHVRQSLMTEDNRIDLDKLQMMGRMGGNYYVKAFGDALTHITKPNEKLGVGFDALPEDLLRSKILTGSNLAKIANFERLPIREEIDEETVFSYIRQDWESVTQFAIQTEEDLHKAMQILLGQNKGLLAWQIYLRYKSVH